MLPEVRDSSGVFGEADPEWLGRGDPDGGHGRGPAGRALRPGLLHQPGSAKNTYGTGCFLLMNTGEEAIASDTGLLTTWPGASTGRSSTRSRAASSWPAPPCSGCAMGSAWWRTRRVRRRGASVEDTGGVYLVPAFVGLGAPYWDERARGALVGLTRGTTREHLIRATLESIAYQTRDVVECLARTRG